MNYDFLKPLLTQTTVRKMIKYTIAQENHNKETANKSSSKLSAK